MASVGKIKFSNILPVRLLPPSGINFHSTYPQVWLFFSDKKSACWHWPIWWSIVAASLALCCYSLVIRGSWDCHAAFHSESNQPQIATNLPKNTEQTDPKRCDHLSKHLPSRNDESRILPSISFCASMQTEVGLVNLGLTSFNNVLIRSLLKLLVIHLTRWKLSHNFHLLLKKIKQKKSKRKKKTNIKVSWYNNLSRLTPLFMTSQRLCGTTLQFLQCVTRVHMSCVSQLLDGTRWAVEFDSTSILPRSSMLLIALGTCHTLCFVGRHGRSSHAAKRTTPGCIHWDPGQCPTGPCSPCTSLLTPASDVPPWAPMVVCGAEP